MRWVSRGPGPITCCGITPRTPSTCSATRRARRSCARTPSRGLSTRRSASPWTCRSSCRPRAARSARCRCHSTTTGRSARSSATSAINGTYIARYDELVDGKNNAIDVSKVDVSLNGIELQDREFFAAIREKREPNSSVAQVLPCYRAHDLERHSKKSNYAADSTPIPRRSCRQPAAPAGAGARPRGAQGRAHELRPTCARPRTMRFATS